MTITEYRTIDQELCPSCFNTLVLLSVVDATISTPTTKEEPMEYSYSNPDETAQALALQELIQKKDAIIVRLQDEISNLSQKLGADHQNCDYWKSENGRIGRQLIALVDNSYDKDLSSDEILTQLCEIIDYEPIKTIEFSARVIFNGSISIPRYEAHDFDLEEILSEAYIDINNGNVVIDNYKLYNAEEC